MMQSPIPDVLQHPKDAFIAAWKTQSLSKRAALADALIERLFGSGFGVLGKSELELCVVALLDEAGAFATLSNNDLSLAMGITDRRVQNLLYAARLRYGINDNDYLRRNLNKLLTTMSPELVKEGGVERVRFAIEDGVLHQVLDARVKAAGGAPDTGNNPEIFSVEFKKFQEVVFRLIPADLQSGLKAKLGDDWRSKVEKMLKLTIQRASGAAIKGAVAKMTIPALTATWNFAQPHTAWLGSLIDVMGKHL